MIRLWRCCMVFFKRMLFVLATGLISCGGGTEESTNTHEGGTTISATLSSLQTNVFTPTCATSGCHSSGSASGGLVLEEGSSFANLVSVGSTESSLTRVLPGDPDQSYLVNKLEGTQASAGGSGSQMPRGSAALSEEEMQAIRDWIAAGAENN